mgnify:CR=1 FL=1
MIRRALKHIPVERAGAVERLRLRPRRHEPAHRLFKMVSIARGANIVRKELGLPEARCLAADPLLFAGRRNLESALRTQGSFRICSYHEIPGTSYGTPKEMRGFRTPPQRGNAVTAARSLLAANEARLGLTGLTFGTPRRIKALAPTMSSSAQRESQAKPVHRAYVTVHLDRRNRVYLIKNRACPGSLSAIHQATFFSQSR